MAEGTPIQSLADVPQSVRSFVLGAELIKRIRHLTATFGLSKQAQDEIVDSHYQTVMKEISLAEFVDVVNRVAAKEGKRANDLKTAAVRDLLLPIDEYFDGKISLLLGEQGKDTISVKIPSARPAERSATGSQSAATKAADPRASKIAEAVIAEIGLGDKNLEAKLRDIIVARVAGLKDDLETKAMLKRSSSTGGVGLEDSLAETLVSMIKEKAAATPRPTATVEKAAAGPMRPTLPKGEVVDDQNAKPRLAGFVVQKKATPAPAAQPPKLTTNWLQVEEVSAMKAPQSKIDTSAVPSAPMPKAVEPAVAVTPKPKPVQPAAPSAWPSPKVSDEQLIKNIVTESKINFENEVQRIRFTNAMKNRIRDIRDQFETRELLLRSENLGGIGLSAASVDAIVPVMERVVGDAHQRMMVNKKEELQKLDMATKAAQQAKTVAQAEKTATEQNERYKALVASKSKSPAMSFPKLPGFLEPKRVPTVEVPETMSGKKSAAVPRPSMEDIKFSPSLVGPIEELKNFSLQDWQTLGGKISFIKQKLAVLRNESYTKYLAGLAAFKESPLFNLAQELLAESFENAIPLAMVIDGRKSTQKPYLSQAEINDIMIID